MNEIEIDNNRYKCEKCGRKTVHRYCVENSPLDEWYTTGYHWEEHCLLCKREASSAKENEEKNRRHIVKTKERNRFTVYSRIYYAVSIAGIILWVWLWVTSGSSFQYSFLPILAVSIFMVRTTPSVMLLVWFVVFLSTDGSAKNEALSYIVFNVVILFLVIMHYREAKNRWIKEKIEKE